MGIMDSGDGTEFSDDLEELEGLEEDSGEEQEEETASSAPAGVLDGSGTGGEAAGEGEPGGMQEDPGFVPFVHLHVHSHYSILDGAGKIDALIARAKELGMDALALTDHGNMHGALEFYQKCKAAGIKPIPGYEAYIAPGHRSDRTMGGQRESSYHLTLLAMNEIGFHNLIMLATRAYKEGFYYKPRIDKELLKEYHEGVVCLSGCISGEISRILLNGNASEEAYAKALEVAKWYKELFGDRYYIELQDHGLDIQKVVLGPLVQISRELGIPTVATNDVHYVRREDNEVQDILLCINTGRFRTDVNRMRMETDEFFLRSGREMVNALPDHEDAVRRTVEIADRCNLELELGKRFFPNFTPPDGKSSDGYLRELCIAGLKRRYAKVPKRCRDGELSEEVMERLNRELGVIKKLGFANYFLIVWDFVRVAEERGIQRTARGSGVGALVCYALNLSHVCPLEFDLLFERFLDENRLEAPDIDIDFDKDRRGEIIDYVKEHYGTEKVAQIGVFGTLAARNSIKDVGRVLGAPLADVNAIANLVPEAPKMTLAKAFKQNPEFVRVYDENPEAHELVDYAMKVEGLVRSTGVHACAVVIAQRPLTDFVPVLTDPKTGDDVTQWPAGDVEKAGLLKMDFLGLRNLTILANAIKLVEETTGKKINPYEFPLDDKETYALLCRGETKGVFQLESGGMRELLSRMKPDNFRDIIATLALYRPGPLEGGMVSDYIDVKHKRKEADYAHPVMEDVLKETNGVMVYQEQIMRIFNRLGKIPLSKSYSCIKAISKKKEEQIKKNREDFVQGAMENGLTEEKAREIFALIEKFAGYGFNKSHSTAYARIAYITAYLKAHFPAEFMAALLNGDISKRVFLKKDSTVEHLEDCKRMGIEVVFPHINLSYHDYRVRSGKIMFGLTAIKGCGEEAILALEEEREKNGPFKGIFDFYERMEQKVGRSLVEALIKCGAFDGLGGNRAQMFAVVEKALKAGQARALDRQRGQQSFFDKYFGDEEEREEEQDPEKAIELATIGLPDIEEWDVKEKAGYEKEVLGFFLTVHPLAKYEDVFRTYVTHNIYEAKRCPDRTNVVLGGMISSLKLAQTKNPKEGRPSTYAMFDLEDTSDTIRAIIWPEAYDMYKDRVKADETVFVIGRIDRSRSTSESDANLIIDQILTPQEAETQLTSGIRIVLRECGGAEQISILNEILKKYRVPSGGDPVELWVKFDDGKLGIFRCPVRVQYQRELRDRVTQRFGDDAFRLIPSVKKR